MIDFLRLLWADEGHSLALPFINDFYYPWEALSYIEDFIEMQARLINKNDFLCLNKGIYISKKARIASNAVINGPCIIGEFTEVRPGAFVRGCAVIGKGCVIGNSTEVKNSILFDSVQVPHFNYVGDSILGYMAHFGAGVITSNVKCDKSCVCIKFEGETVVTERKKLGALVGDHVEVGCNSILNPGTVIGKNSTIYPLLSVRGIVPENSIYKSKDNVIYKE